MTMKETMHKRDLKKIDKRERIIEAARDCFRRMGFDQAKLSDIAKGAQVAKGTLFSYAASKHDLLVMVFLQELTPIVSFDLEPPLDGPIRQRLLEHFERIARHAQNFPDLTRLFQKEMAWLSGHADELDSFSKQWHSGVARLLDEACAQGQIRLGYDAAIPAMILTDCYLAAQRRWLLGEIDFAALPAELALVIDIILRGAALPAS